MANFFRRAGAHISAMLSSSAAPGSDATVVQWFAQTVAGVIQMFMEDSDGLIYQVTPSISVARAMAYYLEDFMGSAAYARASSGGASNQNQSTQGAPGQGRSTVTSVGNTEYLTVATSITGGTLNCVLILGSGQLVHEFRGNVGNAQDGTNQWIERLGLGDTLTGDQANGVYLESDRALNGDNNYRLCAANGSTRTKTTTSQAPTVTTTFTRWRFVVNAGATSIQAYKDDVAAGSAVTTNITANPIVPWFSSLEKTLGSSARNVFRDYHETYQVLSR